LYTRIYHPPDSCVFTSGRVEVNGVVPHKDGIANARQIGAVFGQRSQLWRDLTARQSLEVLRDLYGLRAAVLRGVCPNCGGELVRRPIRPARLLAADPPSTRRVVRPGCAPASSAP
jgi:Protein of unknown function (DUF1272)